MRFRLVLNEGRFVYRNGFANFFFLFDDQNHNGMCLSDKEGFS